MSEKPWVKSYCGGKPNYCTPVDAVDTSQDRVDETAKGEHEPIGYIDGMHGGYMVFTPINPSAVYLNGTALYLAPPKKEWVGLTDVNEMVEAELTHYWNGEYELTTGARDHLTDFARAIEAKLKEKNT